ncbi:hypothetical protein FACS189499_06600 [Clostridia bacterium]|nr:hypothetical protein FACS189499_06600 [Clostridia bacterium]
MLELKNIKKTYKIGEIETKALDGITVSFREKEFVAILGTSGSGKTTCLNIIGGLDRYDSGELAIKGKATSKFKERDWDAYRNNSVGFVFQSYNLIGHLSIVANVELGMTLSGVPSSVKHRRALEVLNQVGLHEHLHKKPNQLSGGQMQRVAIARALANDPEVLLCDEPTGALDTATSKQIMDLIQEVAADRLVIMVTHNPDIAEKYAKRIIRFQDGKIISDSNPYTEEAKDSGFSLKKTAMNFATALKLSGANIMTKKGRTFLTAFASSIGIIGIALILSLSTGFQKQIDGFQTDAIAEFPIIITNQETPAQDDESRQENQEQMSTMFASADEDAPAPLPTEITVYDPNKLMRTHQNVFTDDFLTYLKNVDPEAVAQIGYTRLASLNIIKKNDGEAAKALSIGAVGGMGNMNGSAASMMSGGLSSMASLGLSAYPETVAENGESYLEHYYDLVTGSYPQKETDMVIVTTTGGKIPVSAAAALGFTEAVDGTKYNFADFTGMQLRLIDNNDYYQKVDMSKEIPIEMLRKLAESSGIDLGEMSDEELRGMMGGGDSASPGGMSAMAGIDFSDPAALDAALSSGAIPLPEGMTPEAIAAMTDEQRAEFMAQMQAQAAEIAKQQQAAAEEAAAAAANAEPQIAYLPGVDYDAMWNSANSVELNIVGIVRLKEDAQVAIMSPGIAYSDNLTTFAIERGINSDIVKAQQEADYNIFDHSALDSTTKDMIISSIGGSAEPYAIMLYPKNFEGKDKLLQYLDDYNNGKSFEDKIFYTDLAGTISGLTSGIMDGITLVLIGFASISLVVSLVMIAIITYTSVLERTKEIGVLRALGARRKDVTRVFDAETFIIGALSGALGIFIAWALTFPINVLIADASGLKDVAGLELLHAAMLFAISTLLTVLGGHIPARMAAKKDAVEALRSE